MENEKFVNYYIEILNNNLYDAISKNVVFQAKERIKEEHIKELEELTQKLNESISTSQEHISRIEKLNSLIEALNSEIENKVKENNEIKEYIEVLNSEIENKVKENNEIKELLNKKGLELSAVTEKLKITKEKLVILEKPIIEQTNSEKPTVKKEPKTSPISNTKPKKENKYSLDF